MLEQERPREPIPEPEQPVVAVTNHNPTPSPLADAAMPSLDAASPSTAPDVAPAQSVNHGPDTEVGTATEGDSLASGLGSIVRRGMTTLTTLRVLNLGLTGTLCGMNVASGNPGLAALWGTAAVCWGVSLLLGESDNQADEH